MNNRNEYDDLINNQSEEQSLKLRSSFLSAAKSDPEQFAKVYDLAKKTGLPTEVVEREAPAVAEKYEFEKNDYDALLQNSPRTAEFLSEPENAKLAKDDVKNLVEIEELAKKHRQQLNEEIAQKEQLISQAEAMRAAGKIKTKPETHYFRNAYRFMYDFDEGFADYMVGNASIDNIKKAYTAGEANVKLGSLGFDLMTGVTTLTDEEIAAEIKKNKEILETNHVEGEGFAGSLALGVADMLPQLKNQGIKSTATAAVGGLGTLAITKSPQLALKASKIGARAASFEESLRLEAGSAYLEYRDITDVNGDKLDPKIAKMAALGTGLVNAGIEMLQLDTFGKNIPGIDKIYNMKGGIPAYVKKLLNRPEVKKSLLASYVEDTAFETMTEMAQSAFQILFREVAKDLDDGVFEENEKTAWQELGDQFMPTFSTMAGTTMLVHGVGGISRRMFNQQTAEQINKVSEAAKLYERAPDKAEAFIKKQLEDSDIKEAFIPAADFQELFQSDIALADKLIAEAGLKEEYDEALKMGSHLIVPTEKLATMMYKLKDSEFALKLQENITFDEADLTVAEAKKNNFKEFIGRDIAKVSEKNYQIRSDVYDGMMEKLLSAGYTRENAQPIAVLYQTFADNMRNRGADDGTWFDKTSLKIVREGQTRKDTSDVLDTAKKTLSNEDFDTFLSEFNQSTLQESQTEVNKDYEENNGKYNDTNLTEKQRAIFAVRDRMVGREPVFERRGLEENATAAPKSDGRGSPNGIRAGLVDSVLALSQKDKEIFEGVGLPTPSLHLLKSNDQDAATSFYNAITNAKKALGAKGDSVYTYPVEDYTNMKLLLTEDGLSGIAVKPDGDIVSVFSASSEKYRANTLILAAIQNGGKKLDCFDTFLPKLYADFGFKAVARNNWNDEFAPEGWNKEFYKNFKNGKPDVVYMVYDPKYHGQYNQADGTLFTGDTAYEDAVSLQSEHIKADDKSFYQSEKPEIEIKGDFLGQFTSKEELRKAAFDYMDRNLRGRRAFNFDLGADIEIRKAAIKKYFSFTADEQKLKAVPYLLDIISKGKIVKKMPSYTRSSERNIKSYYELETKVMVDGESKVLSTIIKEDDKGNFFWDLQADKELKKEPQTDSATNPRVGVPNKTKTSYNQNIAQENDNFNLKIVDNQEKHRGSISFLDGNTIINLFQKADLSTMLHETGHLFVEAMRGFADKKHAPMQIKEDYHKLCQFVGAKEGEKFTTPQHETLARAFEAYLLEGKAPSVELQSVFSRFKYWLVNVYRNIRGLNVQLNDEIRGVFDRMLASDEQISEVRKLHLYDGLLGSKEKVFMTEAEWKRYRTKQKYAYEEAVEKLERELMKDIIAERHEKYLTRKQELTAQLTEQVNQMPVYQAIDYIIKGRLPDGTTTNSSFKLDRQTLIQAYGADIEKIPSNLYKINGVDPDIVATMFDFNSVEELISQLSTAGNKEELVKESVKEALDREFARFGNYEELRKAAEAAAQNEHQLDLMLMEDKALRRKYKNGVNLDKKAIIAEAEETIEKTSITRLLRTGLYKAALDRISAKVYKYAMSGNFEMAVKANYTRILDSILLSKAINAADEVESMVKYLDNFNKSETRKSIDPEYLDQIDNILERFDLRRSVTQKELVRRKSFAKWKLEQEAIGNSVEVDTELMISFNLTSYKEMSFGQLKSLRDSIKNIHHLAKLKERLLSEQENRNFDFAINKMVESIGKPIIKETVDTLNPTAKEKFVKGLDAISADHMKAEFLCRALDNYKDGGAVWEHIFNTIAKAENYELEEMARITQHLNTIFGKYNNKERANWGKVRFVEPLGRKLNKLQLFALALNLGNEHNKKALLKGWGWKETAVNAVLNNEAYFSYQDWQTVQEIWDMLDKEMWPKIKAVCEEVSGIAPDKVKPLAVLTKWGQFRGGYYPVKYDPESSFRAFTWSEKDAQLDGLENQYMRAQTKKGHTKERTAVSGEKVRLQLDVLYNHIKNTVHDYTHRKALIDVQRFVADERLQKAIVSQIGLEGYKQLKPWLQGIANDFHEPSNHLERIIGRARMGATVVAMGWKITTALAQPLGFLTTADALGAKETLQGIGWFYQNPLKWKEKADWVMEKSTFMKNRTKSFDRDVRDFFKAEKIAQKSKISESYFYLTAMLDMAVCLPTWEAAYHAKFKEMGFKNEKKAIAYADMIVRTTQGGGGIKDLAKVQRGSESFKMFTMFYSYFSVLYNRFAETTGKYQQDHNVPKVIASCLYLWFVPAVLGELMAARGPGEEENDFVWALKELLSYPFQAVIGLRDIVNAVKDEYGYKMTPVADALAAIPKAVNEFKKDEIKPQAIVTKGFEAFSYWKGLPAKQINITVGQFFDWLTGDDDDYSFRDLFFYKKH